MRLSVGALAGDAWALWRRDRALILAVAGPFLFLPQLALLLMAPWHPVAATTVAASVEAQVAHVQAHWGWYLAALLLSRWGEGALTALYLARPRPDVRAALAVGLQLLPRFVLASVLVSVAAFAGLFLLVLPSLIVVGRTLATGPVLVAERPVGGAEAIARAVVRTRGHTLTLTATAVALFAAQLLARPLVAIDQAMRGTGAENPVAVAIVDLGAAGLLAAADLAGILIGIALYVRLASRGT
jgi:hypothetical protein